MTIVRVGSNEQYASNWDNVFGAGTGKGKPAAKKVGKKAQPAKAGKKSAKKAAPASAKKKPAKKKK